MVKAPKREVSGRSAEVCRPQEPAPDFASRCHHRCPHLLMLMMASRKHTCVTGAARSLTQQLLSPKQWAAWC